MIYATKNHLQIAGCIITHLPSKDGFIIAFIKFFASKLTAYLIAEYAVCLSVCLSVCLIMLPEHAHVNPFPNFSRLISLIFACKYFHVFYVARHGYLHIKKQNSFHKYTERVVYLNMLILHSFPKCGRQCCFRHYPSTIDHKPTVGTACVTCSHWAHWRMPPTSFTLHALRPSRSELITLFLCSFVLL